MRQHTSRRVLTTFAVVGVVALLAYGCRSPTQVTLDLSTNVRCDYLKGVDILVGGEAKVTEERAMLRFSATSTNACRDGHIGTLVVTPSGNHGAVVVIAGFNRRASECVPPAYEGCIVARRQFSFIEHVGTTLPIFLEASCVDVPCNATSTCDGNKQCVDSHVDCRDNGSCGPPGRSEDGGLVFVDGSVEDAPVSPLDGGVDPGEDGGMDGGLGLDAGDSGLVAGPFGVCPLVLACPLAGGGGGGSDAGGGGDAGMKTCGIVMPPVGCCNDPLNPTTPRCETMAGCGGGFVACCGRQGDCPMQTACCASKSSPVTGTVVACGAPTDCTKGGNTYVCRTQGAKGPPECPGTMECGLPFGPPGYFKCQ